jgi:hypothetical protein
MNNDDINNLFIKEINNNIIFNEYKKINIFTTKFGYYIAESMKYILKELINLKTNPLYSYQRKRGNALKFLLPLEINGSKIQLRND